MKTLRVAPEVEVIAEFLRNEYHHREFDRDRNRFASLVASPNLQDDTENAIRRALLYRRRGHLWNQLPARMEWWEVRLEPGDLDRLHMFARTHWRKIGGRNCALKHIVERMRYDDFSGKFVLGGTAHGGVELSSVADEIAKVRDLSGILQRQLDTTAALLIGTGDSAPVTILEGNHRMAAALMVSPELLLIQFRVFFGTSPDMTKCCWYGAPTARNIARYAWKRLKHLGNREADLGRVLPAFCPEPATNAPQTAFSGPLSAGQDK